MLLPSKPKFLSFPLRIQHKIAASALRIAYQNPLKLRDYEKIALWMGLEKISTSKEAISDRYHKHLKGANVHLGEHDLLPHVRHFDRLSDAPRLAVDIYLDRLRSAHNVGSIIRTVEAFRLGNVYFSSLTPFITNKKVQNTSMGCDALVTCFEKTPLFKLPTTPLIALETTIDAIPLFEFTFPEEFTLLLGNEETGLSKAALDAADQVVQIPLLGSKNSLNVACAFAAVSVEIRRQRAFKK